VDKSVGKERAVHETQEGSGSTSTRGEESATKEVGAGFTANQSPFGGVIKITGRIGDPPDSFNGPAAPCGYVIRLLGCDRTIRNSGFVGSCEAEDIGFCLEKKP
jgi:hypothetical protein